MYAEGLLVLVPARVQGLEQGSCAAYLPPVDEDNRKGVRLAEDVRLG